MGEPFHQRYLRLVDAIERNFPVDQWRAGDVDIWPLARMDLYLDMYWQSCGSRPADTIRKKVGRLAAPLRPVGSCGANPVQAVFLGDGVSVDRIHGYWQDRFCEPLIATLESCGQRTLLMQGGDMRRQPWHRPVLPARIVEAAGHAFSPFHPLFPALPCHKEILDVLSGANVTAPSLSTRRLARRARIVSATAFAFQRILRKALPKLAFVVTWYAGLGPAFVLACRRQRIMSVDLQHCPQGGGHKAYTWQALPRRGFSTVPAVFWTWTSDEAQSIDAWAGKLPEAWHRGFHGGHVALSGTSSEAGDAAFRSVAGTRYDKEILVALQTLEDHRGAWSDLADQIENAPPTWRWWIRRHPAARPDQDGQYAGLLNLRHPNVLVEPASFIPLATLLRNMDAVVSLSSGTSVEASTFGVPSFFLCRDAEYRFGELVASGAATVVEAAKLIAAISAQSAKPMHRDAFRQPSLSQSLGELESMASHYAELCAGRN